MSKETILQKVENRIANFKEVNRYLDVYTGWFPNILGKSNFYLPAQNVSDLEVKISTRAELEMYNFTKMDDGYYKDYEKNSPYSFRLYYSGVRGVMNDFYTLMFILDMFQRKQDLRMTVSEKELREEMKIDIHDTLAVKRLRQSVTNLRNTRFNLDIRNHNNEEMSFFVWMLGSAVEKKPGKWFAKDTLYYFQLDELFQVLFAFDKFSLMDLDVFTSLGNNNHAKRFFVYLQSNSKDCHLGKDQVVTMMNPKTTRNKQTISETRKKAFDVLKERNILQDYHLSDNDRFYFRYRNKTMDALKETINCKQEQRRLRRRKFIGI